MVMIIHIITARQIVLLFIVCVALGVLSAPVPITPRVHKEVENGVACGGAADTSKSPCQLDKRFYPLPPSIQALVNEHREGKKLPSNLPELITGKGGPEPQNPELARRSPSGGAAQVPLVDESAASATKPEEKSPSPPSDHPSESSAAPQPSESSVAPQPPSSAEAQKPKPKPKPKEHDAGKAHPAPAPKAKEASPAPVPAAQKPLVPPELQAPKPDPVIHPLHDHHVRLRPRHFEPEDGPRLVKRYYPLGPVLQHLEDIGYIPQNNAQKPLRRSFGRS